MPETRNLQFVGGGVAKDEGRAAARRRRVADRVEDDDGAVDERVGADETGDEGLIERVTEAFGRVVGRQ